MPTERTLSHQITRTFRAYGGDARKSIDAFTIQQMTGQQFHGSVPDQGAMATPEKGQPDYYALLCPFGFAIEAKYAADNFGFDEIRPEQRAWLTAHACNAWLWLWMGERVGGKDNPLHAYLVPWFDWVAIEAEFAAAGLKGIAHQQAHLLAHREQGLCAVQRLAPFALTWHGDGVWQIPPHHLLWIQPRGLLGRFDPTRFNPIRKADKTNVLTQPSRA